MGSLGKSIRQKSSSTTTRQDMPYLLHMLRYCATMNVLYAKTASWRDIGHGCFPIEEATRRDEQNPSIYAATVTLRGFPTLTALPNRAACSICL